MLYEQVAIQTVPRGDRAQAAPVTGYRGCSCPGTSGHPSLIHSNIWAPEEERPVGLQATERARCPADTMGARLHVVAPEISRRPYCRVVNPNFGA
eukprot:gene15341-biopygen13506